MAAEFKSVSFGGYDKKQVDIYIEETEAAYRNEIEELKENVAKLSDTVKSLHTMREVNQNESKATIDELKRSNESLEVEVEKLREEVEVYRKRDVESANRYESISKTLLSAREFFNLRRTDMITFC